MRRDSLFEVLAATLDEEPENETFTLLSVEEQAEYDEIDELRLVVAQISQETTLSYSAS